MLREDLNGEFEVPIDCSCICQFNIFNRISSGVFNFIRLRFSHTVPWILAQTSKYTDYTSGSVLAVKTCMVEILTLNLVPTNVFHMHYAK